LDWLPAKPALHFVLTMSDINFRDVFSKAMGDYPSPYAYQCRLACGPDASPENIDSLRHGTPCRSQLINIPTGLGKTAAVVIAWLWNRVLHPDSSHRNSWPRRLVYCLPMRTLVEQTRDSVKEWLERPNLLWDDNWEHRGKVGLHILMGGEDDGEWDLYPEHEAILIGTQDMLLSRALNRGYGMSRYRWPMHFGLLNNDCLWVYDEVQLMGSGVPTTAQLESFRRTINPVANCYSFWMSATLKRDWLKTVDFEPQQLGRSIELSAADLNNDNTDLPLRHAASKRLSPAKHSTAAIRELAQEVFDAARAADGMTLVVVNIVQRARDLHREIAKLTRGEAAELLPVLIHSRFRPGDRKKRLAELLIRFRRCGRAECWSGFRTRCHCQSVEFHSSVGRSHLFRRRPITSRAAGKHEHSVLPIPGPSHRYRCQFARWKGTSRAGDLAAFVATSG